MQAINDIKFLNDYNEVAHENLIAIIKQNLFFQTQIKGLEEKVKLIPQLEEKLKEVTLKKEEVDYALQENVDLKKRLEDNDYIATEKKRLDVDKFRVQTALNTKMKELNKLKLVHDSLKEYNEGLEKLVPVSKLKKYKKQIQKQKEDMIAKQMKEQEKQIEKKEEKVELEEVKPVQVKATEENNVLTKLTDLTHHKGGTF